MPGREEPKKKLAAITIPKSKSKTNLGSQGMNTVKMNEMKKIQFENLQMLDRIKKKESIYNIKEMEKNQK